MTDQVAHDENACAAMGATTDDHARLQPFVGTFNAEVKMWMGPGEPLESTGKMINSLELGGRFLCHDYKGDPNDGPFPEFEGKGFWGFNTVTKKYEGMWVDNASTILQTETGDVDADGKVWTMHGEMPNPEDGSTMKKRSVITLVDNDHHVMEMYFSTPGGEFKGMEIKYSRA